MDVGSGDTCSQEFILSLGISALTVVYGISIYKDGISLAILNYRIPAKMHVRFDDFDPEILRSQRN
jgi:hypothetical protein